MPWYRTGTVSVTLNSNAVVGTGTAFLANSRVGDAFIGPDGGQYEVTNIASNTSLSITPNYRSASNAAGAYALMPVQGYTKDLADQARAMIQQWGATLAGLGTVSTQNTVPVTMGGTGGTTPAAARTGLQLGSAAVASIGYENGNVADAYATGRTRTSVVQSWLTNATHGLDPNLYPPGSPSMPSGGTGYWYKQIFRHSDGSNRLTVAWPYGLAGNSGTIKFQSIYDGATTPWIELYHTGNTTRGSGGVLSAASPIMRIACVATSERRDLQEQTFEPAGGWGVVNSEARGVSVERLDIGVYKIHGSLGLAFEGWRTQDPCSPDGGGTLGVTESEQSEDGTVIIRLFKQRWTLSDDGEMAPGRGAPIDVPLNSWIDVRLEMPKIETPPPPTFAEE